jgi:alkyldihydroxyacetonephosphate synthase
MKRIQGWGDIQTDYPVPEPACAYLEKVVGKPHQLRNTPIRTLLEKVLPSRLPSHPLISTDPEERLRHARGQSLNDWVEMFQGLVNTFPDGVAYPETDAEAMQLVKFALKEKLNLIPYGGGSSVVGHLTPPDDGPPTICVDLARMNQLLDLNEENLEATLGAGISGPQLEAELKTHGFILGHFPQSWEYSTLGGWIVTRSVGQQSYHYGRIEPLFVNGHLETPAGPMDLPHIPKSAAGPDLRHLILGSEARMGILTRATMRVRRCPEEEHFYAAFFPNFEIGAAAVRKIAQSELALSMVRLSDPLETETTFQLSGEEKLVNLAKKGLNLFGQGQDRCMLIYGLTGSKAKNRLADRQLAHIVRSNMGLMVKFYLGEAWMEKRFLTPYLRNTLWDLGYALDTLETALPWEKIQTGRTTILETIRHALEEENETVLAFSHISHVYTNGGSMYITYLYRRARDPHRTLARWQKIKNAASKCITDIGGTISHQHGVGLDHKSYLHLEKDQLSMQIIKNAIKTVDPAQIMNTGKLIDVD